MKKYFFIFFAVFATPLFLLAQEKLVFELTDGSKREFNVDDLSRLYFIVPDSPSDTPVPDMIDLGLPSGIKWANCNLGASRPEECGDYFAWGETEPKSDYRWDTYLPSFGSPISSPTDCGTSKDPLKPYLNGYADKPGVADGIGGSEFDAAHVILGGNWRMPTKIEQDELRDNCTWTWSSINGMDGYLVTSNTNGNSIFLPAAGYRDKASVSLVGKYGYYWSSSVRSVFYEQAYDIFLEVATFSSGYDYRYEGQPIRPVSD